MDLGLSEASHLCCCLLQFLAFLGIGSRNQSFDFLWFHHCCLHSLQILPFHCSQYSASIGGSFGLDCSWSQVSLALAVCLVELMAEFWGSSQSASWSMISVNLTDHSFARSPGQVACFYKASNSTNFQYFWPSWTKRALHWRLLRAQVFLPGISEQDHRDPFLWLPDLSLALGL